MKNRNIKKEKALEQPQRESSVMRYKRQMTEENLPDTSEENNKQDKPEQTNTQQPLPSVDPSGPEILIDPDEDPEVAAAIDAELRSEGRPRGASEVDKPKPPFLPPLKYKQYTLVLDLDETLIHYKDEEDYYLVRPGVNRFLRELSELYDIVLFTASVK